MKDHVAVALIAFAVMLPAYCSGCAPRSACEPKTVDALSAQYARLAVEIIDSGACDKYASVVECPAYRLLEEHQAATLKGLGCK